MIEISPLPVWLYDQRWQFQFCSPRKFFPIVKLVSAGILLMQFHLLSSIQIGAILGPQRELGKSRCGYSMDSFFSSGTSLGTFWGSPSFYPQAGALEINPLKSFLMKGYGLFSAELFMATEGRKRGSA